MDLVSGMLGIPPPRVTDAITVTSATTIRNPTLPNSGVTQQWPPYEYYCTNPIIPVTILTFVFNLLSSLIFTGVGAYMMLNGKKR